MAPRRPRKNDEAVESLIRNPSSKTDFRSIGNQQVRINLMFPGWKPLLSRYLTGAREAAGVFIVLLKFLCKLLIVTCLYKVW